MRTQSFLCGTVLRAAALACMVIGCTGGDPFSPERGKEQIDFSVQGADFHPGETIVATLENRSAERLGYNLCFADLQRRVESTWSSVVRQEGGGFCPLILLILAPGESASLSQPVLPQFPAGEYRFEVEVEWLLGAHRRFNVATESFGIGN